MIAIEQDKDIFDAEFDAQQSLLAERLAAGTHDKYGRPIYDEPSEEIETNSAKKIQAAYEVRNGA